MHATYKNALMWTLYGVLFLLIAVLQTVVFGRARFFGVKLTLIPVCIACVSMLAGAEAGALYGLCCGTVWCFTGAAGGAMHRPATCPSWSRSRSLRSIMCSDARNVRFSCRTANTVL